MRHPTSLFTRLGFPRGGLCLRCYGVPFVRPTVCSSVRGWEGIRLLLVLLYPFYHCISCGIRLLLSVPLFVLSLHILSYTSLFYGITTFFHWLAYLFCYPIFLSYPYFLAQPSSLPSLAPLCYRRSRWVLCQCSVCLVSVLVLCPRLERSSLRSRGILSFPLYHNAFQPVDNSVFSVDIYHFSVYNYPYLYSVIGIILSLFFLYIIFLRSYSIVILSGIPQLSCLFLFSFSFFSWERLLAGASFPRYIATYSKALSISSSLLQPKSTQLSISGDLASPCILRYSAYASYAQDRSLSFDATPQHMIYQQIPTA